MCQNIGHEPEGIMTSCLLAGRRGGDTPSVPDPAVPRARGPLLHTGLERPVLPGNLGKFFLPGGRRMETVAVRDVYPWNE